MKKIGIEEGLSNVTNFLISEGYSVQTMKGPEDEDVSLKSLDAIIISGLDTDTIGYSDVRTKAQIINADGLTPQEVKNMIERQN